MNLFPLILLLNLEIFCRSASGNWELWIQVIHLLIQFPLQTGIKDLHRTNPALRNTIYRKARMTVTHTRVPTCHKSANTKPAQAQHFFCQPSEPPTASPPVHCYWAYLSLLSDTVHFKLTGILCLKSKNIPLQTNQTTLPLNTVHSFSDNLYMLVKLTQYSDIHTNLVATLWPPWQWLSSISRPFLVTVQDSKIQEEINDTDISKMEMN